MLAGYLSHVTAFHSFLPGLINTLQWRLGKGAIGPMGALEVAGKCAKLSRRVPAMGRQQYRSCCTLGMGRNNIRACVCKHRVSHIWAIAEHFITLRGVETVIQRYWDEDRRRKYISRTEAVGGRDGVCGSSGKRNRELCRVAPIQTRRLPCSNRALVATTHVEVSPVSERTRSWC